MKQRREVPVELEWPVGEAIRARIGKEAYELDVELQCCGGLNFGYFYEGSPIIAYDGDPHPTYTMRNFSSSTVPGCRVRHLWLADGRSLYDALGRDTRSSASIQQCLSLLSSKPLRSGAFR